jgi:hypothetical protein
VFISTLLIIRKEVLLVFAYSASEREFQFTGVGRGGRHYAMVLQLLPQLLILSLKRKNYVIINQAFFLIVKRPYLNIAVYGYSVE